MKLKVNRSRNCSVTVSRPSLVKIILWYSDSYPATHFWPATRFILGLVIRPNKSYLNNTKFPKSSTPSILWATIIFGRILEAKAWKNPRAHKYHKERNSTCSDLGGHHSIKPKWLARSSTLSISRKILGFSRNWLKLLLSNLLTQSSSMFDNFHSWGMYF